MDAEIITIGSELLLGQIANTNAQFLSKELALLGINVYYHTVVGDNDQRLKKIIHLAQERSDLVIFTGGLGPTKDDLTKETIAEYLGTELVINEEALAKITSFFKRINRHMTENNRKQAIVLKGARILNNRRGLAPGMVYSHRGTIFMLFPGPPRELQPMFLEEARPYLMSTGHVSERIISRVLHFFGIGESQLETELEDLIANQSNPTIAPLAGDGEVRLRLTAKSGTDEEAIKLLDGCEAKILERVGHYFYGYDNTSLPLELTKSLENHQLRLASAESLTGGLFSKLLTDTAGTSKVFNGGIVSYTNDVKRKLLDVPEKLLETEGAVSRRCAEKMADHVRLVTNADIGISFTGVAGPENSEGKPVGTVFIGISERDKETTVYSLNLVGSRKGIRQRAVNYGFYYLLRHIKKGE